MSQIRMAIGIEMPSTWSVERTAGTDGRKWPMATPTIMQSRTQTVR